MFHVILLKSSGNHTSDIQPNLEGLWKKVARHICMQPYLVGQVVDREVVNGRFFWSHWKCNPRADEILGGQVRHHIS